MGGGKIKKLKGIETEEAKERKLTFKKLKKSFYVQATDSFFKT